MKQSEIIPFPMNGCVPVAWSHVARKHNPEAMLELMERARPLRRGHATGKLVTPSLAAWTYHLADARIWARLAGVRIRRIVDFPSRDARPTTTQFARRHARGTWIVLTTNSGHAQALVDGAYRGGYYTRARVERAFRVEAQCG